MTAQHWDIYFSLFMFTADLQPNNPDYSQIIIRHLKALKDLGYAGFDMPIAPIPSSKPWPNHSAEVASYQRLKDAFDKASLQDLKFTTNVAAWPTFDPSSNYLEQRQVGLDYLKSRVDITAALGGEILGGPILVPYGGFPTTDFGDPIWSDNLQAWLEIHYANARTTLAELADYAESKQVKLAIEPVDHWEQPGPNMVSEVRHFLSQIENKQLGACVDSAHVVLGSNGPQVFREDIAYLHAQQRLHYVQISAPDRGAVHDSWIPWDIFLPAILPAYKGPLLIEVFNAIPAFANRLRLTRAKFYTTEDEPTPYSLLSAYDVAELGIQKVRAEIDKYNKSQL
jgi:sugar phosphate isomerase/epimerase